MTRLLKVQLLFVFIYVGCSQDQSLIITADNNISNRPEQLDDGWQISTLNEENVDINKIENVLALIEAENYDYLRSILIVKNGKLIFEKYFIGDSAKTLFHTQSATKSIASVLIGLAIDRGLIGSVNDPVFMFFPEYDYLRNQSNNEITLQNVLTMTPGFEWNEVSTSVTSQENDNIIGHYSNYIRHLLSKPVIHTPGTFWYYNSGCAILAGGVIKNLAGMQPEEYARRFLFEPLSITNWFWPGLPATDGLTGTHGALYLSARDMAKIGQLYLNGGIWNGNQIISEEWVHESTQTYINIWGDVGYGYLWWTRNIASNNTFYADGFGGQQIVVIPDEEMVVVTTATYDHLFEMETNAHSHQREQIWEIIERIVEAN